MKKSMRNLVATVLMTFVFALPSRAEASLVSEPEAQPHATMPEKTTVDTSTEETSTDGCGCYEDSAENSYAEGQTPESDLQGQELETPHDGSTIPKKKLTLTVTAICAGKVKVRASASGYGATPPMITITVSPGRSASNSGSVTHVFTTTSKTFSVTAKAKGYQSVTKSSNVIQLNNNPKDYSSDIRNRALKPMNDMFDKIGQIPVLNIPTPHITKMIARGTIADCCLNGKKQTRGFKEANVNGAFTFNKKGKSLGPSIKFATPSSIRKFLTVSLNAKATLPLGLKGNGTATGKFKSQKCAGTTCLILNCKASGVVGGVASATLKAVAKIKVGPIKATIVNKSFAKKHFGTLSAPLSIKANYAECPERISGNLFLGNGKLSVKPLSVPISLPKEIKNLIDIKSIDYGGTSQQLWGKKNFPF